MSSIARSFDLSRRTVRRLTVTLAALCFAGTAAGQAPTGGVERLRTLVDSIAAAALRSPVAGLSIGVFRGSDTLILKGYGYADIDQHIPATPSSVYWVGSLAKPFTAVAVLQAVAERRLALEDTVGKWLPEAPRAMRSARVRQLLSHTSGIHNFTGVAAWRDHLAESIGPVALLELVGSDSLDFPLGTRWRYSNTNFVLLGMMLERATSEPFARYVGGRQLRPLRLNATSICDGAVAPPPGARGYERANGALAPARPMHASRLYSSGALCSTVGDLALWARALQAGKLVGADQLRAMTTPEGPALAAPIKYGLGIASDTLAGHRRFHHPGGVFGWSAHLAIFPDDDLIVVVLMNTGPGHAEPVAEQIARLVLTVR